MLRTHNLSGFAVCMYQVNQLVVRSCLVCGFREKFVNDSLNQRLILVPFLIHQVLLLDVVNLFVYHFMHLLISKQPFPYSFIKDFLNLFYELSHFWVADRHHQSFLWNVQCVFYMVVEYSSDRLFVVLCVNFKKFTILVQKPEWWWIKRRFITLVLLCFAQFILKNWLFAIKNFKLKFNYFFVTQTKK